MKKIIIGSLFATAMLFAHDKPQTSHKVSSVDRESLATQSPPVHVAKYKGDRETTEGTKTARITSSKDTINAYIPAGK